MTTMNSLKYCTRHGSNTLGNFKQELRRLEQCRHDVWNNPTITVGLHGIPNAGKTAYLVGLYLHRNDTGSGMTIRFDEKSAIYLRSMAEYFVEHGRIESTAARSPRAISFAILTDEGLEFRIKTRDLAGRFVEPGGARDIGGEARVFLSKCNAILCFADCRQPAYPIEDAIDLLPTKSTVVFIPTKIDELFDDPKMLLEQKGQQVRRIYESLDSEAAHSLDQHFRSRWPANRYRLAPVAALGPIYHRGQLHVELPVRLEDLRPWNIFRPWQMVVGGKKRELQIREIELEQQIAALKREIEIEEERTQQEKADFAEKRGQREAELRSRLEDIESGLEDLSENLPQLLIWRLRLQQIAREADAEDFPHLANRANQTRMGIDGIFILTLVVVAGVLAWISLFFYGN